MKVSLHHILFILVLFSLKPVLAIDYYWVGGTGNWGDINKWSLSSGGAGGAGVPGVNDNVFFNNSSFTATSQTVTLNIANANCNNMTWSVTTRTPNFASSSSANNLNIYGNLAMVAAQGTWTTGMNVYFMGTGTKTINSGGKTFGPVFFAGTGTWSNLAAWTMGSMTVNQAATINFNFPITQTGLTVSAAAQVNFLSGATGNTNGSVSIDGNGTVNYQANRATTSSMNLNYGTLLTNGTTQTWGSFSSQPCCVSTTRTLNLGSSTINVSGTWSVREGHNLLLTAGTSQINMTGVSTTFQHTSSCCAANYLVNFSYNNISFTSASGTVNFLHYYNSSTDRAYVNYNNVTFGAGASITGDFAVNTFNFALNGTYLFQSGRTVTVNTLFNANATCAGPMTIKSANAGTQAIISKASATVSMNYCNIKDMNFIGGSTSTATNSIDQGNNTGITIQAGGSAASRTLYWRGGTGNWNDVTKWSLTSGGVGGECPPTSIDDVIFNNASFTGAGQTVTMNVPNADCRNMTWSVTLNTPNFASSSTANNLNIYGNLAMVAAQGTWSTGMNVYFMGTGTNTINSGGKTFGPVFFAGTGTWSNLAAWTMGSMTVNQAATINFNFPITQTGLTVSAAAQVNFLSGATGNTNGSVSIDGNGTVNYQANRATTSSMNLNYGTLLTNGTTQTWGSFSSQPCCVSTTRTLNLGSSTINVSGTWSVREGHNLLLTAGTSQINMTGVSTTFQHTSSCCAANYPVNFSYNNISFTSASGTVNFLHYYNSSTDRAYVNYNNVTFGAGANITGDFAVNTFNFALNGTYLFESGRTVTVNTLFNANATCAGPITLKSGTAGTQANISKASATVSMNYCNLQDMNFIGGSTSTATNSINQGNNTGITIQAGGSAASRTLYWRGGTGNWNDVTNWSLTSGGVGGECPPTSIDDVIFNNASFTGVGQTVTMNVPNADCRNMTWSVTLNTPNFASSSTANNLNIYGNLAMVAAQGTWSTGMNVYFMGTGTNTINSGGKTFGPVFFAGTGTWSNLAAWTMGSMTVNQAATINFNFPITQTGLTVSAAAQVNFLSGATGNTNGSVSIDGNGTVNYQANRATTSSMNLNYGTLLTNGTTQTWGSFSSQPCCVSTTRTLNLGSSTINVSGTWSVREGHNLLLTAGTSQINMTGVSTTFQHTSSCCAANYPVNFSYNNISFTSASGTVNFLHYYNSSTDRAYVNYNNVTFGAGANITGDFRVGTLSLTSNNTYNLQADRTMTVTNNISFGSVCFGGVTIQSATAGTQAFISKASGIVSGQNLTIKDLNATGGATYNAYGSTNMGNNTGWNFATNPALGTPGAISTITNGYSVAPVAGAVSYTWTMPLGTTILGGQGTNVISATGANGQICVTASNGCGTTSASSCINTGVVSMDLGTTTNTNVCQGSSSVNLSYVGTNGSPNQYSINFDATANAAGIADITNATLTTSPLVFAIPSATAPGVYNGVLTVTNSTTGISSVNYTITVSVVGNPTIAISNTPAVCQGITSSSLTFTSSSNSPNQYSIDYSPTANTAGFLDVSNQALSGSSIGLVVPAAGAPASYTANLTIVNTTTSCQTIYPITVTINANPSATFGGNPSVVSGTTSSSIALSSLVGAPNQYSIDYAAAANTAGFVDLNNQALSGTTIPITIPGSAGAGTYNATVVLTNSTTGCSSVTYNVSVTINATAPPTITLGANPSICTGTTSANLTYTNPTNNPNQYTIDFNAAANTAGLLDVAWTTLPASPIAITVPAGIAAGTYTGTVNVRNTVTGITGTAQTFTVTVSTTPAITLGNNPSVSVGVTSTAFTFSAPVGSPNQYTLDFSSTANTAGFTDQTNATLSGTSIPVTIPNGTVAGNYTATLVVTNTTTGCSSQIYNVVVSVINGISYYWVGGTGNWSEISHWANTSGGMGGIGIPGSNDNVFFDNNSFSAAGQTVTVNIPTASCNNMTWTGATNTPSFNSSSSSNVLNVYGSLTLVTGMNYNFNGSLYFLSNGPGNTLTSAGKTFNNEIYFNGSGAWTLQDNLTQGSWRTIRLNSGTLNTNDKTITAYYFNSVPCPTSPRALNLGASTLNIQYEWRVYADNLTLNAGTSTININYNNTEGYMNNQLCNCGSYTLNYNNVNFSATSGVSSLNSTWSSSTCKVTANFNNLSYSAGGNINGDNTIGTLTLTPSSTYLLQSGRTTTITNTIVAPGTCAGTINIRSNTTGSTSTVTKPSGAVTMTYVNLMDLAFTGGATWTANNSISQGNVSGITINSGATATPRTLYWVGGTGNWNDINRWSLSSGGPGGECPPTTIDDVMFTSQSFTAASQSVTINVPSADCKSMTWTGVTNTPSFNSSSSSNVLNVYGSLTLVTGMNYNFNGSLYFLSNGPGNTLTSAGKTFNNEIYFNGSGAWTLQDNLTQGSWRTIRLNSGTLNTNDKTITAYYFNSVPCPTSPRVLNLGASTLNIQYEWRVYADNLTLNAGTSTININYNNTEGYMNNQLCNCGSYTLNYNNVNFSATSGVSSLNSTWSSSTCKVNANFNNLSYSAGGNINGDNTIGTLTLTPSSTYLLQSGRTTTITNTIVAPGTCAGAINIRSNTTGSSSTVTKSSGAVTMTYVNLKDLAFAGGATWTANNSIDQGNVSGITINSGATATPRTLYWVGGTGNWNDINRWSLSSGGPGGECPPTTIDDVMFTAQSFTAASQSVTINVPSADCKSMTWTGVTNTPSFNSSSSSNVLNVYGSLTLVTGMNYNFNGSLYFLSNAPGNTLTSAGKTFNNEIYFNGSGTWTLQDNLTQGSWRTIRLNSGTLNTNDKTITAYYFNSVPCPTSPRVLNLGASTLNIQYEWRVYADNLTLNAGTSTININYNNTEGYMNNQLCNCGSYTLNYNNVNFSATSGVSSLNSTWSSSTCKVNANFNNLSFSAGGNINGDNAIGTLSLTPFSTYNLQSGRTQSILNNINFNSACNSGVTIQSNTTGTAAFISKASGVVSGQNLSLRDVNATGGATFNAYASNNLGNNTGWNFLANPTLGAIGAISQSVSTFTVPFVTGAVSYSWSAPVGSTITSGQGTNTVNVLIGAAGGQLCVTASNGCGAVTTSSCINLAPDYIPLNTLGVFVSEDFNTLSNSGTSSVLPTGWRIAEAGTNANSTYTAGTGSSNTGDSYSFGLTGSNLRTLGGLLSGSIQPSYGARFLNNTGSTVTSITVVYTGETWRVGTAGRPDKIDFQYSLSANALNSGAWIDIDSLDYQNISQSSILSGAVLHSAQENYTFQGLSIPAGSFFWIRWTDTDVTGADDGMGINDFSIKPCGLVTNPVASAQNFCNGATLANLTATGTALAWYNSNIGGNALTSTTSLSTGTYYVSQTISGCESPRTAVSITVNPSPNVTATATPTSICAGQSLTLTGGGATSYTWSNGVANGTAFSPSSSTTYTVTGTGAGGCTGTASVTVNYTPLTTGASLASGDLIWHGRTSTDYASISNWSQFNGTNLVPATAVPTTTTNVIIPVNQTCVSTQPNTNANNVSAQSLTIETGASLVMNNGSLNVSGNWTQFGSFTAGTGTVTFNGTSLASISAPTGSPIAFNNLVMNNTGDVQLSSPISIAGALTLTSGDLILGANNLNMASSTINGGSGASYIQTNGVGMLQRNLTGSFVYPIGRSTYNPVTLTKSGAAYSFGVRVVDQVTGNGQDNGTVISVANVGRMWHITPAAGYTAAANGAVDVTLSYLNNASYFANGFLNGTADRQFMHYGAGWENITGVSGSFTTGVNGNNYTWTTQSGVSDFSPFTITNSATSLPIELISFQANCNDDKQIEVSWSTASEHNTSHYVVERTRDGINWTTLGLVAAAGNSTQVLDYELLDATSQPGVNYYRLIQYDNDGAFEVFNVAAVTCGEEVNSTQLVSYPNPSANSFSVALDTKEMTGTAVLSITDARGSVVHSKTVEIQHGHNVYHIADMTATPGVYYIQVSNGTSSTMVVKHCLD